MLGVLALTAAIRFALWWPYQIYEARVGHVVYHEQVNEMLLLMLVEVLGLGILGFMMWRLSRLLLSPIRSVANAATLIAQGKLGKRIRTQHLPEGELLDIAEALNSSFDRYQEAIDRISRFSSAASHQLRTPLTAIRTTAELCLSQPTSTQEHEKALLSILEEVEHLSHMTEQLLLLSRMESEHLRDHFVSVNLNGIVRRVVDMYMPMLEGGKLHFEAQYADACPVHGDDTLLMEAVMNLVDNAIKLSGTDGSVRIETRAGDGLGELFVTDSGPGIDADFREHLFERFSRHPATPYRGSGLGLSIVNEVVRLHDGQIDVTSGESGGATFHLVFPALGPPSG
jgi:signal transduction histidine kinase